RFRISTVTWSEHSATSLTRRSVSTQYSDAPREVENTISLTGPASLASSPRTASRSRSVRIAMGVLRSASRRHYTHARAAPARRRGGRPPARVGGAGGVAPPRAARAAPVCGAGGRGGGGGGVAAPFLPGRGPGGGGGPRLLQEVRGDLLGGAPERLDVREHVE